MPCLLSQSFRLITHFYETVSFDTSFSKYVWKYWTNSRRSNNCWELEPVLKNTIAGSAKGGGAVISRGCRSAVFLPDSTSVYLYFSAARGPPPASGIGYEWEASSSCLSSDRTLANKRRQLQWLNRLSSNERSCLGCQLIQYTAAAVLHKHSAPSVWGTPH